MTEARTYIWPHRWESFQHYRPDRDRPPAWIKSYTKQLRDERYLDLTDRQRALLHDLRYVFAVTFGRVPRDCAVIGRHRHRQTFRSDLDALNHAGFVDFVSRETLEQNLESLYSKSSLEVEKEKEKEKEKEQPHHTPPIAKPARDPATERKNGLGGDHEESEPIEQTVDQLLKSLGGS